MKRSILSRRRFLETLLASGGMIPAAAGHSSPAANLPGNFQPPGQPGTIDRHALVDRHSPLLRRLDPLSPLSLGNGEFAFTADITGLQTFPREYDSAMPLCTMSQWGWHTSPLKPGLDSGAFRLTECETHGRQVAIGPAQKVRTNFTHGCARTLIVSIWARSDFD